MRKILIPFLLIAAIWGLGASARAEQIDFVKGLTFGRGFDTVTGEVRNQPIEAGPEQLENIPGTAASRMVVTELLWISDRQNASEKLTGSASASLGIGPFGGSASGKFLSSFKSDSYSAYCLVKQKVLFAEKSVKLPPTLTEPAKKTLDATNGDFRQMFGDTFVLGVGTGAEYIGVVEIKTSSLDEKNSVSGDVGASYLGLGSASAELAKLASNANLKSSIQVRVFQNGGPAMPIPSGETAIKQLIENLNTFNAADFSTSASPVSITLAKNEILDNRINNGLAYRQKQNIDRVCSWLNSYDKYLNDIGYILSYPDEFEAFDSQGLFKKRDDFVQQYNSLMGVLEAYINTPSASDKLPEGHPTMPPNLPQRLPASYATVSATNLEWQPTGVTLEPGERAIIVYTGGLWSTNYLAGSSRMTYPPFTNADGYNPEDEKTVRFCDFFMEPESHAIKEIPDAPLCSLIGKTGASIRKIGGRASVGPFTEPTTIELKMNDWTSEYPGGRDPKKRNRGMITVAILRRSATVTHGSLLNATLRRPVINKFIYTGKKAWQSSKK